MSRGRKRKPGRREPSGKIQRLSAVAKAEDTRIVALNQPHRRSASNRASDRLWCPVGRLIEEPGYLPSQMSKAGLYEAAMKFYAMHLKMVEALDSKRPWANSTGGGDRPDMTKDEADGHILKLAAVKLELRRIDPRVEDAVDKIITGCHEDSWVIPFSMKEFCRPGLVELARVFRIDISEADKEKKAA